MANETCTTTASTFCFVECADANVEEAATIEDIRSTVEDLPTDQSINV